MEKEKIEEIFKKLKIEKNKWEMFYEIDRILLKSGVGIYPDWKHLRFRLIDGKIQIKHGTVEPYGARLSSLSSVSGDYKTFIFNRTNEGIPVESSSFYSEWFRQPKIGDYIRLTEGLNKSLGESPIMGIKADINSVRVDIALPLKVTKSARISFYDPSYLKDRENCVHSSLDEGIYMHFLPNDGKRDYHEEIKFKDIISINLKVGSSYKNKTYKLD